jgi:predicted N-acyltransferase
MSMSYRIAHSIQEFDEVWWDAVAGIQIAMTHRWHRVMEASLRDYQPLYILLEDRAGPLAVAVTNPMEFLGGASRWEALLRRAALFLSPPYSSLHCGLAIHPGTSPAAVIPHLEGALEEVCRQKKRLLWGISNVAAADLPTWREHGFYVVRRPPLTYMDLSWPSYETYLAAFSHTKRRRLRRMRSQAEEKGVTLECHHRLATWGSQLYPLLCEVYAYHGTEAQDVPFTEEVFTALDREMPGEVVLFVGRVRGELAGFALGLVQGQALWAPMAGLCYELARSHSVYFLLLDEIVRWGICHNFRHIYTGLTSYQAKQMQGFQLQPRWLCFRANWRPLNAFLGLTLPLAQRILGQSANLQERES